ncbi:protein TolR [Aliidiomarina halalkaliphila]|uniref:Tol-Pal system protein TolR n=1 Tax=Aliidiomarina halalkaliphila TaxID=2593535 RepID=A0A552X5F6_9GAMM|nr:protein TolR [Aliidiomarina halalkaliphila]TRW50257.1 protein TolR [Aliidiomarina halalkaliphila]
MEAFIQRRKRTAMSEMNVVPYIDVMLVLLIIFMVAAPLITQGVDVELPRADAEPLRDDDRQPLVATVDRDGNYFINMGDNQDSPMSAVDLATLVAAHLQLDPETPVVVRGDGQVAYAQVVQLMVLLQRAGAPKVGLMTQPPE